MVTPVTTKTVESSDVLAVVGAVAWLGAEAIVGAFTTDETSQGAEPCSSVIPTFGLIGLVRVFTASLRGAGTTLDAALIVVLVSGIIRLSIAQVGAVPAGPPGVWISIAVTNPVGAALAYARYRRGTWRDTSAVIGHGPRTRARRTSDNGSGASAV